MSNVELDLEPLPWPSELWTASVTPNAPQMLQGELVADKAPAFLSFDYAAASFFAIPPSPTRSFSGSEFVVRGQDRRGRIDSVAVRSTGVVVGLSGEGLGGATLVLGGSEDGAAGRRL